MREFDSEKTRDFFNNTYAKLDTELSQTDAYYWLTPRDKILLDKILAAANVPGGRVLDFGCGQGRLLRELLNRGYDGIGVEAHVGMAQVAIDALGHEGASRILVGSLDVLRSLPSGSLDVFIAMGVFQYLRENEQESILREAYRLLRDNGRIVCTFQNALFDLYTFNKYTVDFFANELLGPHLDDDRSRRGVETAIASLVANPTMPGYRPDRARDNIYVRLSNPLCIGEEFQRCGYRMIEKYFYEFFGLPPLVCDRYKDVADKLKSKFEIENATAWEGHFMANAFLVDAQKISG